MKCEIELKQPFKLVVKIRVFDKYLAYALIMFHWILHDSNVCL